MVKESWGTKRTCPCGNGVRFYDLNKKEVECPTCGENINIERLSISILENSLRKKAQAQPLKEKKNINIDKDVLKNKDVKDVEVEIDSDDAKTQVEEIIGKKKLDKSKEKEN